MRSQKRLRIVDAVLAVGACITLLNNTQRKTLIARPPNRTTARPHDRTTAFHAGHLIPGCVRKYTVRTQILGGIDMFVGRNAAICRKSKSTGDSAGAVSLSRSRHSHCSDPKCTNPTLPPKATCCHTLYRSDEWLSAMYLTNHTVGVVGVLWLVCCGRCCGWCFVVGVSAGSLSVSASVCRFPWFHAGRIVCMS